MDKLIRIIKNRDLSEGRMLVSFNSWIVLKRGFHYYSLFRIISYIYTFLKLNKIMQLIDKVLIIMRNVHLSEGGFNLCITVKN